MSQTHLVPQRCLLWVHLTMWYVPSVMKEHRLRNHHNMWMRTMLKFWKLFLNNFEGLIEVPYWIQPHETVAASNGSNCLRPVMCFLVSRIILNGGYNIYDFICPDFSLWVSIFVFFHLVLGIFCVWGTVLLTNHRLLSEVKGRWRSRSVSFCLSLYPLVTSNKKGYVFSRM